MTAACCPYDGVRRPLPRPPDVLCALSFYTLLPLYAPPLFVSRFYGLPSCRTVPPPFYPALHVRTSPLPALPLPPYDTVPSPLFPFLPLIAVRRSRLICGICLRFRPVPPAFSPAAGSPAAVMCRLVRPCMPLSGARMARVGGNGWFRWRRHAICDLKGQLRHVKQCRSEVSSFI